MRNVRAVLTDFVYVFASGSAKSTNIEQTVTAVEADQRETLPFIGDMRSS